MCGDRLHLADDSTSGEGTQIIMSREGNCTVAAINLEDPRWRRIRQRLKAPAEKKRENLGGGRAADARGASQQGSGEGNEPVPCWLATR